jgi:hypothetical protein
LVASNCSTPHPCSKHHLIYIRITTDHRKHPRHHSSPLGFGITSRLLSPRLVKPQTCVTSIRYQLGVAITPFPNTMYDRRHGGYAWLKATIIRPPIPKPCWQRKLHIAHATRQGSCERRSGDASSFAGKLDECELRQSCQYICRRDWWIGIKTIGISRHTLAWLLRRKGRGCGGMPTLRAQAAE